LNLAALASVSLATSGLAWLLTSKETVTSLQGIGD
jgi:hypothetical protein